MPGHRSARSPSGPPWWDLIFLKGVGLAFVITGLLPAWRTGAEPDLVLCGIGALMAGGREAREAWRAFRSNGHDPPP